VFTSGPQGAEGSRYPADGITNEKAKEFLLDAIGADVDCTVESVMPWSALSENAERNPVYNSSDIRLHTWSYLSCW
jgi:hypothetical protein